MSIFRRNFVCICCALVLRSPALGQQSAAPNVVVTGENETEHDQFTELGEYAQPAWAERSRMSSTTSVYVLSPYEFFVGNIWEGNFGRHGGSTHELTQEIDFGLLHRFELGVENELDVIRGDANETGTTFEARYAFANWNALPFNPTVSAEYILGFGKSAKLSDGRFIPRQPDAIALRLLLGQNFGDHVAYGANFALEQDVSRGGRNFDFSQAITYGGTWNGKLEFGAESQFTNIGQRKGIREQNELAIGPTIGWKPTRQLRIGFEPLFGCTHESPRLASLLLVSYEFGGAEAVVPPVPHD